LFYFSQADRIDYTEYLVNVLSQVRTGGTMSEFGVSADIFYSAALRAPEIVDGSSRLLSSDNPTVRDVAESLLWPEDTTLPNGAVGRDISAFSLALQDPKVRKDRLIPIMFRVGPVETAQWLADHTGLPADERAKLEPELQNAWKLHRALNDQSPDKGILADSVRNPLLDHWLHSPSWILRSLATGLLQKRTEPQSADLNKAMQSVQVPAGLQISSTDAQAVKK
jgi:hypothetical protein